MHSTVMLLRRWLLACAVAVPLAACGACGTKVPEVEPPPPSCAPLGYPALGAVDLVEGVTFDAPVFLAQAPGDDLTHYVVQKGGLIRLVRGGAVLPDPFLDLSTVVTNDGEMGLLGLAFHPGYADAANGRFFVFYVTEVGGRRDVVAEYARSAGDPDVASPTPVQTLVSVDDRATNHNGGMLAFGPDGYLYVGIGDEGGSNDQYANGQNTNTLFGSLLRLDVDAAGSDFAAPGNPFLAGGGLPQIWAYGLRNPWRFSFDRANGDLYVGDVGQDAFEEIDRQPAGTGGGANYGWSGYEGDAVFYESVAATITHHTPPLFDYPQGSGSEPLAGGCSVTGGYVYRGSALPGLVGAYLYGDYCKAEVAALRLCEGTATEHTVLAGLTSGGGGASGLSSFAEDHAGELYLLYVDTGHVRRIVASP